MKESTLANYQENPEKEKRRYFVLQTKISDPTVKSETRIIKKYLAAANKEEVKKRMKLLIMNDFSLGENEVDGDKIEAREISETEYWRTITKMKRSAESAHK
jgi:hypothetical protein